MKLSLFKTEFPIMLAPMAGFTDMTYRSICREHGCDFTFTEMISAKGLKYGGKSADLMETTWRTLSGAPAAAYSFSAVTLT